MIKQAAASQAADEKLKRKVLTKARRKSEQNVQLGQQIADGSAGDTVEETGYDTRRGCTQ